MRALALMRNSMSSSGAHSGPSFVVSHKTRSFCAEDWPALWAMVRAECDVATVSRSSRKSAVEEKQSEVRKVATLARSGQRGRALAAARNAPRVKVTANSARYQESLISRPAPCSRCSDSRVEPLLDSSGGAGPDTLRRMPRLSGPGPLGMRAEHRYDFGAGDSNLFVQVVAHIAAAAVPHSVQQYPRSGQVTPLAKLAGGHRPLLMMSFLRRLALKSVMAARKNRWLNVLVLFNMVLDDLTVPTQ